MIAPIMITVAYVSSYFAMVCWNKHTGNIVEPGFAGDWYGPVYWMIDETPMRPLMLEVSRSFGVEPEVEHASHKRKVSVLF